MRIKCLRRKPAPTVFRFRAFGAATFEDNANKELTAEAGARSFHLRGLCFSFCNQDRQPFACHKCGGLSAGLLRIVTWAALAALLSALILLMTRWNVLRWDQRAATRGFVA